MLLGFVEESLTEYSVNVGPIVKASKEYPIVESMEWTIIFSSILEAQLVPSINAIPNLFELVIFTRRTKKLLDFVN